MSKLIFDHPENNWLLQLLYDANKTDVETYRIYQCLSRYIDDNREFLGVIEEVVPNVLRYKPLNDLADDCFFSVSVMPAVIRSRKKRRGAPGVRYYSRTGQNAYKQLGYTGIANNWGFWVSYVNNHICLDK